MSNLDENLLYKRIGAKLKKRRRELNLTQAELSQRIGMQRTSVTNIESGSQHPPLSVLYEICKALSVEIYDVLPAHNELVTIETTDVPIQDRIRALFPMGANILEEILRQIPPEGFNDSEQGPASSATVDTRAKPDSTNRH